MFLFIDVKVGVLRKNKRDPPIKLNYYDFVSMIVVLVNLLTLVRFSRDLIKSDF